MCGQGWMEYPMQYLYIAMRTEITQVDYDVYVQTLIGSFVRPAQLGLVYDGIQRFMERAQDFSQAPVIRTKRGQGEQGEQTSGDRRR